MTWQSGPADVDVEEAVFMSAYIPRSLHELPNSFEEARRIAAGETEQVGVSVGRRPACLLLVSSSRSVV